MKVLFGMPLRQITGFVESVLRLVGLDWAAPDFGTLCRRQKTLNVSRPYRGGSGPLNLLIDSNGFLRRGQRRLKTVRRVAAVTHAVAMFPFVHRLLGRAEPFRQNRRSFVTGLARRPHSQRFGSLLVKMDQQVRTPSRLAGKQSTGLLSAPPHSLRTDRAMKNADRRGSM